LSGKSDSGDPESGKEEVPEDVDSTSKECDQNSNSLSQEDEVAQEGSS